VVKPETALIRPYVVAAVLRGVTFDATRYNSFIDLQVRCCAQRVVHPSVGEACCIIIAATPLCQQHALQDKCRT
jgi:phenylalanyl-tRNA synthetase beta chain